MPLPNTFAAASARGYGAFGFQSPSDPNFSSVSLLLPGNGTNGAQNNTFLDSSVNNFTITRNGNTTQGSFSPFPPASGSAWSAAANGGSGYFDGSGDYLGVADSTAFDLNTTFTVEGWFYQPTAGNGAIFARGGGAASWSTVDGHEYQALVFSSLFYWQFNSGGGVVSITATAPAAGAWHHFAVGYNGTTTRVWLDGASIGTSTSVYTLPSTRNITRVGFTASSEQPLTGYVSNLRVVKGTDVYGVGNTSITVPTAPLTAITNTSLLLNFTNGAIYDAAAKNDLETVGNAQTSTTQSKWGGSSMYFDGTADYLFVTDNPGFTMGSGNFTIEFWMYPLSTSRQVIVIQIDNTGTNASGSFSMQINASTKMRGSVFSAGVGTEYFADSTTSVNANVWTHTAFVRNGNTATIYLNGVAEGTVNVTGVTVNDSTQLVKFGDFTTGGGGFPFFGYLQDIRITKGVARYTSNFTPPTAPFPVR